MSNNLKSLINRNMYKEIKKFDHRRLESFLQDIYKEGYNDAISENKGVSIEDIENTIRNTKGIGTVKYRAIKSELDKLFEKGRD